MRVFLLLPVFGLVLSCATKSGAPATQGNESAFGQSGTEPPGSMCNTDSQCRSGLLDGVMQAGPAPAEFTASPCVAPQIAGQSDIAPAATTPDGGGTEPGISVCRCTTAAGLIVQLTAAAQDECLRFGQRALRGQCLFARDEFPGCDLGDQQSCEAPCNALREKLIEDAEPARSATLRSKRCLDGRCSMVFEINGACFHNDSERPFDCALSDDEIRAASKSATARTAPSAAPGDCADLAACCDQVPEWRTDYCRTIAEQSSEAAACALVLSDLRSSGDCE